MLVTQGHRGFKAKVGGLSLAEDISRMETVREVIGSDRDLMIDVNRAWDLKTAIEGARLLEPLDPIRLEEPVRWMDDRRASLSRSPCMRDFRSDKLVRAIRVRIA